MNFSFIRKPVTIATLAVTLAGGTGAYFWTHKDNTPQQKPAHTQQYTQKERKPSTMPPAQTAANDQTRADLPRAPPLQNAPDYSVKPAAGTTTPAAEKQEDAPASTAAPTSTPVTASTPAAAPAEKPAEKTTPPAEKTTPAPAATTPAAATPATTAAPESLEKKVKTAPAATTAKAQPTTEILKPYAVTGVTSESKEAKINLQNHTTRIIDGKDYTTLKVAQSDDITTRIYLPKGQGDNDVVREYFKAARSDATISLAELQEKTGKKDYVTLVVAYTKNKKAESGEQQYTADSRTASIMGAYVIKFNPDAQVQPVFQKKTPKAQPSTVAQATPADAQTAQQPETKVQETTAQTAQADTGAALYQAAQRDAAQAKKLLQAEQNTTVYRFQPRVPPQASTANGAISTTPAFRVQGKRLIFGDAAESQAQPAAQTQLTSPALFSDMWGKSYQPMQRTFEGYSFTPVIQQRTFSGVLLPSDYFKAQPAAPQDNTFRFPTLQETIQQMYSPRR